MCDEQRERFHQYMKEIETRYQENWDTVMMADYCWTLKRDIPTAHKKINFKRQKFKTRIVANADVP